MDITISQNFKRYNSYILNKRENVSFSGVKLGEFKTPDISKNWLNIDFTQHFDSALKDIGAKYGKMRSRVSGFFKRRKINKISEQEMIETQGFMKNQEAFLKTQDECLLLWEQQLEFVKKSGENLDIIANMSEDIQRMKRINEKSKEILKNKSQLEGFDSLGGYAAEKLTLSEEFIDKIAVEMAGENVDITGGILFFGPNGNGKTSFAKAFAKSAGCNFDKVKGSGKTLEQRQEDFMNNLLEKAEKAQEHFEKTNERTILLADEFDEYANENSKILPELKSFMENCSQDFHCTIFATTNNPLDIPAALRSDKRFGIKVFLDPPDRNNTVAVFKHYLKGADCEGIDYDKLADKILEVQPEQAYNNSQIEAICTECMEEIDGKISLNDLLHQIFVTEPGIKKADLLKFEHEKAVINTGV